MKFSHTMDISAKIKKALLAVAIVLFAGQSALMAQADVASEAAMKRLIEVGKYSEAIAMGNKMLAQDPKNDKVDYLMGLAYFELESYNDAGAWFTKGQNHSARNPMNFVGGGAVAAHNENLEKTKSELAKAVELNTKQDPKVFLAVANAYLNNPSKDKTKQQPYWTEAELYLYKVQKLAPNDAESYVLLGKLYGLQGVAELEESMYVKAIEKDPKYIYGYFRLGQLYKKQAKYQEAAEKFQKCIELDPGFGPAYLEMAEMWTLAKKYDKAEENMTKYLQLMGAEKGPVVKKMIIEYLGEQYDKAIATGERALQDTNAVVIKRLLAYSYIKKTPADAVNSMKWFDAYFEATKNSPKTIIATDYEFYGKAWQLKGDYEQAVKYYNMSIDKATENGEPNNELYNVMSEMYKEKKDTLNRIVYLRKYIQAGTKYQLKENFALGQAYWQHKDFMLADSVFDVMTQKMPDLHIGWSWRGRSNASMDPGSKLGKAMPYYQKVIDLLGNDAEKIAKYKADYVTALRYFAAYNTLVTEKFPEATGFWNKILELDPADADAKNGMDYIKSKGGGK
jgi:tetratricopeptide (TPR) repeat protein